MSAVIEVPEVVEQAPPVISGFERALAELEGMSPSELQTKLTEMANKFQVNADELHASIRASRASEVSEIQFTAPEPLIVRKVCDPYPVDALPNKIRLAVNEVEQSVQAPTSLIAATALSAISIAVQGCFNVARDANLIGPTSLFMLTVADSGDRKSTAEHHFISPIREYERDQRNVMQLELQNYEADQIAWEARRSGLKSAIQAASKGCKPSSKGKSVGDLTQELRELEQERPLRPKVPRILYEDATPEALVRGLSDQWPSVGIVSDEGGAVTGSHGMGKDSLTRNLATLNKLWGGQTINTDRVTRDSVVAENPRLTLSLQLQEAAMQDFLHKSGALARGTGFLARFLINQPDSLQGTRFYKPPPENMPHRTMFNTRIRALLDVPLNFDNGVISPTTLTLDADARFVWESFYNDIEAQLGANGNLRDVGDTASKTAENAARMAALFEVFESTMDCEPNNIGKHSMASAASICAWHLQQTQKFFNEIAIPELQQDAILLDSWLVAYARRENKLTAARRDVQRSGPNRVRESKRLNAAIIMLVDAKRIRLIDKTIHINPALVPVDGAL